MIKISREEADIIRRKLPDVTIHRTVHKYYVENSYAVQKLMRSISRKTEAVT